MEEIDLLRMSKGPEPKGAIARMMWAAAHKHDGFVTPMAGVAGAVSQTVLAAMLTGTGIRRAYVNNGGDIALYLEGDAEFSIGMGGLNGKALGQISLDAQSPVRGIATSGQGGRSLSFGIAESVTVLARTSCEADVAATLIAGATDLPNHRAITRKPARDVREDSDLGDRDVVTHVAELSELDVAQALENGSVAAREMQARGLIHAASLHLRGQSRQIEMNTRKVLEYA